MMLNRRTALLGLMSAWSLGGASAALADPARRAAVAGGRDPRFVVVIQRGAMDGMAAVVPYGDRNLAVWRPSLLPAAPGQAAGMLDLGGYFALHPKLVAMHARFVAGEAMPIVAVAGGAYRTRSHFEAQDCLESGSARPMSSGWLNRAVGHMALRPARDGDEAIAVGLAMPLLLRGGTSVGAYAPAHFGAPSPDLYARLAALSAHDPVLGHAMADGMRERGIENAVLAGDGQGAGQGGAFPQLAGATGRLLAAPNGPRVAALEIGGWDTHQGQLHRLDGPMSQLDAGIDALRVSLGPAWSQTVVLIMTEFGRTVRVNGTGGTDHGTAGVAFLVGGAVAGGAVRGTWPGLAPSQLFENRDLAPTADLRQIAKGVLVAHLGLSPAAMDEVFPSSRDAEAVGGLLRV